MAISTLAYKITADTKQFTSNVQLTRRELNLAKRVMQETVRPSEKLQTSLSTLERLYKAGAINAREYASATDKVRRETKELDGVTAKSKTGDFLSRMGSSVAMAAAGIAASIGSFFSLRNVLGEINEQLELIDELAKRGRALDIFPDSLAAFRAFVSEKTDLTPASAERALTKAQSLIQLAAIGDTEALTAFELGGQEVFPREFRKVAKKDAIEQLFFVLDRINKLPQELQTAAVGQIFGERRVFLKALQGASLADFLAFEREEIEGRVGRINAAVVEQRNDAANREARRRGGFFGQLAETRAGLEVGPRVAIDRALTAAGISGRDIGAAAFDRTFQPATQSRLANSVIARFLPALLEQMKQVSINTAKAAEQARPVIQQSDL